MPTIGELCTFLDTQLTGDVGHVQSVMAVIASMVSAYTRGAGFDDGNPNDELASVILLATARLLKNISQLPMREQYGAIVVDYRAGFQGFTLAERSVLNRYRVQAV
ncbi:hypothetical protein [Mycobacterium timonense]|uniref:Phage gp6-like head-tail connector protein n=1 Tax=Mycobacterium timonense TaxID=701043 RepID=A0A7I9Z0H8_9MYCO|nr:hypothetical protein [Mycobacterium timonense]GFG94277.1 hypothetical protein MTIM_01560 [Mycobacterium timonense]